MSNPYNSLTANNNYIETFTNANNVDVQDKVFVIKGRTLTRTCPHNGCTLNYNNNSNTFVCPCHNSKFNLDGNCISGPACPSDIRL
jgi:Rieske Fe-S protein